MHLEKRCSNVKMSSLPSGRQYDPYLVETFIKKLEDYSISDYHGLISPGLTCYLNSVLQVLFMTEDFREAVKRFETSRSKDPTTIDPYLRKLFSDLERNMAKTHKIIKKLDIKDVYEQRDAAEYFEKILCLTSPQASKIFKGELNHKATCCRCNEKNDSRSVFWVLPLAMEDIFCKTYNVEEGLTTFFMAQKVCGDNQMYCGQCNEKQDAVIEWELTQYPDVLTLLLKRFTFDYKRKRYMKLHCEADVSHTLCNETCTYHLYAIVNHFGNLTGGHYTAEIRSFENEQWYCFDDDSVRRVKLFENGDKSVRSCAAYLLLYRKVSRHPEKTDTSDQEAQCAHSDAQAEERRDEAGEVVGPHFQQKSPSCRGVENFKHLNGDIFNMSHGDVVGRIQTNSSGDKQRNQRAALVREQTNMLPQTDNEADGDNYSPNLHCSSTRTTVRPVEINDAKTKRKAVAGVVIEGMSVKQRTETNASDMKNSDLRSCHDYSNGHPCASGLQLTRCSCSQCMRNRATEYNGSPNLCRKSSRLKRNEDYKQHVVNADSSCKPEAIQTVQRSLREKRGGRKCEDKVKRSPWK